jgi:YVTN family beta-propeller protein
VVTADGAKLYVALAGSNSVAVIDTRNRALNTVIRDVGSAPVGITMTNTNNYCH